MSESSAMNGPDIVPHRIYSCHDVRRIFGKTLAKRMTGLAMCKGRYLGETLFYFQQQLCRQRADAILTAMDEEANKHPCISKTTDPIKREQNSVRSRENGTKKGGRPRFRHHNPQ